MTFLEQHSVHVKSLYPTTAVGTHLSKLARFWHPYACNMCL